MLSWIQISSATERGISFLCEIIFPETTGGDEISQTFDGAFYLA